MNSNPSISAKAGATDTGAPRADTREPDEDLPPTIPETLAILPLRNTVLFPGTVRSLTVARTGSRKLLEESLPQTKIIGVFTQKNPEQDNPGPDDLHRIGVAATVLKLTRQDDGKMVIVVTGLERVAVRKVLLSHPFIRAEVDVG